MERFITGVNPPVTGSVVHVVSSAGEWKRNMPLAHSDPASLLETKSQNRSPLLLLYALDEQRRRIATPQCDYSR